MTLGRAQWLFVLIGFNIFWGGSYSAFIDLKQWLTPGQIVTLRYSLAVVLLFCCWPWMRGQAPKGRDLLATLLMGIFVFVLGPRLQVMAAHAGRAGDLSVLVALEPLVTTVGAALLLREHVPAQRWLGFLFGMLGVVLLSNIWDRNFHVAGLTANLLFIASFFCESCYSILGKPLIQRADFLKVTTLALAAGVVVNLALDGRSTLAAAGGLPLRGWLEIIYLATICTALGYAAWFGAMRMVPVNVVSMTIFTQPFAGSLIAILLLAEPPHWGQLWGGLAIAAGLALGLRRSPAQASL